MHMNVHANVLAGLQTMDAGGSRRARRPRHSGRLSLSISASAFQCCSRITVPPEREVILQSENGILGMGPTPQPDKINRWLINASKKYVTLVPGGAYMHHADRFSP